jgi:hypothetical protein
LPTQLRIRLPRVSAAVDSGRHRLCRQLAQYRPRGPEFTCEINGVNAPSSAVIIHEDCRNVHIDGEGGTLFMYGLTGSAVQAIRLGHGCRNSVRKGEGLLPR